MAKRGHSGEEILRVLRGRPRRGQLGEVCRRHGIRQRTLYLWKRKFAGQLALSELRELRELRDEN